MSTNEDFVAEQNPAATKQSIEAAAHAIEEIRNRSFSGRHPELGKMINCQFCGLRHRENERKCEQKFAEKDGVIYGALVPPAGLTHLTARQIIGAAAFTKRRQRPRNKPKRKMHYWLRVIIEARKKNDKTV